MASRVHGQDVVLVGARKQQDARLTLDDNGITLKNPHAKQDTLIAQIQWPFVFKICRSSYTSGTSDRKSYGARMLDIVVHTGSGLQDLRVACASRTAVCAPFLGVERFCVKRTRQQKWTTGSSTRRQKSSSRNSKPRLQHMQKNSILRACEILLPPLLSHVQHRW